MGREREREREGGREGRERGKKILFSLPYIIIFNISFKIMVFLYHKTHLSNSL